MASITVTQFRCALYGRVSTKTSLTFSCSGRLTGSAGKAFCQPILHLERLTSYGIGYRSFT